MAGRRDSDYIGLYREALSNHEEEIVRFVQHGIWNVLITTSKALTVEEWKDLGSLYTDKEEQAKAIVSKIRAKDTLESYIGFSRCLCDSHNFKKTEIFPFVSDLERCGRHDSLRQNGSRQRG